MVSKVARSKSLWNAYKVVLFSSAEVTLLKSKRRYPKGFLGASKETQLKYMALLVLFFFFFLTTRVENNDIYESSAQSLW